MAQNMTRRAACAGFAALAANPAWPGPAADRLFAPGVYDGVPTGASILYDHRRVGVAGVEPLSPISDGEIEIRLRDASAGREALLEMRAGKRRWALSPYPADNAGPLVTAFLESSLRAVARITGGSPAYIRDRMHAAVRRGGEVRRVATPFRGAATPAEDIVVLPFARDRNRDRMGVFGGLKLRFLTAKAAPGGLLLLSASAGGDGDGAVFQEVVAFQELRPDG